MAIEDDLAKRHLAKLHKLSKLARDDLDKGTRLNSSEGPQCLRCYYFRTNRVAGQGFTEKNCAECHEKQMYNNTDTHNYCRPCAIKLKCCKRCGGTSEMQWS